MKISDNLSIVLVAFIAVITLALMTITDSYHTNRLAIEATKAGLEECSNPHGYRGDTIWKRSCDE